MLASLARSESRRPLSHPHPTDRRFTREPDQRRCVHAQAAIDDVDILNFALNLEYLEAQFYSYAVYGKGLSSSLRGGGPQATGGKKAKLTSVVASVALEIAQDEIK